MNPEHTQDIKGAFPAHEKVAKALAQYTTEYLSKSMPTSLAIRDEFTALKQAADGMREALLKIVAESTYGGDWTVADCAKIANTALAAPQKV